MRGTTDQTTSSLFRHRALLGCLFLILATLIVYRGITTCEFINLDDDLYVTENHQVQNGLTLEGLEWSLGLSNTKKSYWHPLTWISHMLDCEIYGLNPGGHHLTNLLLHILNGMLLFLVFYRMTDVWWPSLFIAALFLLHPLNVDSVAWVAERKNLLSTFFWMLALLAYLRYCRKPGAGSYLTLLVIFCLGLLSKPMLVTLPCVFLLLDYWPLARGHSAFWILKSGVTGGQPEKNRPGITFTRLVIEKLPLLILSAASALISSYSLQSVGNLISTDMVPMGLRVANALISYIAYMGKLFWPVDLAIYYPFPVAMPPVWQIAGAIFILAGITTIFLLASRKHPYLITGWLWYLGTLFPVIGLVQGGLWPALADRWSYVPHIGLFIVIAWGIHGFFTSRRFKDLWLTVLSTVLLAALAAMTWKQVGYWQNSIVLFEHALEINAANPIAHNNLGNALAARGHIDSAIGHYRQALRLNPYSSEAHRSLGNAFEKNNQTDRALEHYQAAVRLKPGDEKNHNNLGNAFARKGNYQKAIRHYQTALDLYPEHAKAHNNIALAYLHSGKPQKAIAHLEEALRINPEYRGARFNLNKLRRVAPHAPAPEEQPLKTPAQ